MFGFRSDPGELEGRGHGQKPWEDRPKHLDEEVVTDSPAELVPLFPLVINALDEVSEIELVFGYRLRSGARCAFRRRLERFVRRPAEAAGAGAPRNKPSVLRSSSRSGQ